MATTPDKTLQRPKAREASERLIQIILLLCAISSIFAIFLIIIFVFSQGVPFLIEAGPSFLTGSVWLPADSFAAGVWGIFPIIVGSLLVTVGAIAIGAPLGIACAVFLAEIAPPAIRRVLIPSVSALAGVPSVVYGFFALLVIVPWIRGQFGGFGTSVLACWIILSIMILPTIISISTDSVRAVPKEYKEGSLAMGATRWQTIRSVLIPAASSGIVASVILGMGRAIGETMAVLLVAGNSVTIPVSVVAPVSTLTATIALEMNYATGAHQQALFAIGVVLFAFILVLTGLANVASRRRVTA
ncbi:MAG TPA: phosphate ABC transporter permease subunit PstC [Candidatus Bathyarchaeia archaeon]|nr:phosphate ABC transporter permease subunit PstC [Candidatus Bathyarchaeia archaeon]